MRRRECDPPPVLLFNGKRYETAAEVQRARDERAARRRRLLDRIELDRLQDEW